MSYRELPPIEGATSTDIQNCILRRLGEDRKIELVLKYGMNPIIDALSETGDFYAGCEEIGSSDITAFTHSFLSRLGEPTDG